MLTIFTVPKPFQGHIGVIQKNAIGSWRALRPECQVILCGDEAGTAETAAALGVETIPDVERNRFGTPLLSSVFAAVEAKARHDILCYVNADILLLSDFLDAARRCAAARPRFLMVGQRWDLDVTEPIAFGAGWEAELRGGVERAGSLHPPSGSDYFVYPRGALGELPEFAVGRPGWDNWMIYRARSLRWPVIDATESARIIHQN
ncbi:MAG: glycosyl transferase family 2, partial [Candidatus Eiseniibacteriota bacterium]